MVTSIESVPPIELADDVALLSRRDFLQRFGGVALGTAGAVYGATLAYETAELINSVGTLIGREEDETWPHNGPSFTWLNAETDNKQQQCIVYLPGFGEMNPKDNATDWLKISNLPDVPMGYLDYSNQGTNLETMVELVRSAAETKGFTELHVVGRSIGGLYSLPFLEKLGMPVKSITFISSPSRLEYGDFGNLGSVMAGLPKWRAVDTMAKTMVNMYRDYELNGFDPLDNLENGWRATMHGANPTALHQELRVGKPINIQDGDLLANLKKKNIIVPGYTQAIYAATYKPATDITVHVQPSSAEYEKVFRRMEVPLQIIPVHYEGHANVSETANRLRTITQASTTPEHITFAAAQ